MDLPVFYETFPDCMAKLLGNLKANQVLNNKKNKVRVESIMSMYALKLGQIV